MVEAKSGSRADSETAALIGINKSDEEARTRLSGHMVEAKILHSPSIQSKFEKASVYGQVIALPQLARSAGWPAGLVSITLRTFIYMILNCFLQVMLLCFIHKEEYVMDKYGGQMNLCDFGAFIEKCPDGAGCTGPAGTKYTVPRLYSWNQWVARVFARDSLLQLFPDKAAEISQKIDPGEYGLEDYWCRVTAQFVFMLAMMEELLKIVRTLLFLYTVPSKAEPWVLYKGPLSDEEGDQEEGELVLRAAGMSRAWKLVNIIVVLIPQALILKLTIQTGTTLLMDTAGIEDVIVNCVALSFLLTIDEMIYAHLNDRAAKAIMEELEDYHQEAPAVSHRDKELPTAAPLVFMIFPSRLFVTVLLTMFAIWDYYERNCTFHAEDTHQHGWLGGWISRPVFTPQTTDIGFMDAVFPWFYGVHSEETPAWEMAAP